MKMLGVGMARTALIAIALLLFLPVLGCSLMPTARPAVASPTSSPEPGNLAGAAAVNAFGFDLMRARLADSSESSRNVVLSPLSVHAALSMTLQGAARETAAEMRRVLHLSGSAKDAASTYALLLAALNDRSKEQTLSVANA